MSRVAESPVRLSEAALALVARPGAGGRPEYLVRWNGKWRQYSLVGGHVEPGESFRACLLRELAEELGLAESRDYRAAPEAAGPPAEYVAFSASARSETRYRLALYAVTLLTPAVQAAVDADPANRWLTPEEIRTGTTADGCPVAEQVARLLNPVLDNRSWND